MTGISIAESNEWASTLSYFHRSAGDCTEYPFGAYFFEPIHGRDVLFYRSNVRKVCAAAAAQYMIDHFSLSQIIVVGTCAGIDDRYHQYDIVIPNRAVQYDCTVKETEPLIKERFSVDLDVSRLDFAFHTGTIGTADKPVVMWKDYLELKANHITVADTEAAGVAYVCKMNQTACLIVKGISDFPSQETDATKAASHKAQYHLFIRSIPTIMNKIYDGYLPRMIR